MKSLPRPKARSGRAGPRPAGRRDTAPRRRLAAWPSGRYQRAGLRLAGAGLLAATGAIHLDLYLTGYRSIPVMPPMPIMPPVAESRLRCQWPHPSRFGLPNSAQLTS